MKKFTVFFDRINQVNYQVLAKDEQEAELKAKRLYKKHLEIPPADVEEGWLIG